MYRPNLDTQLLNLTYRDEDSYLNSKLYYTLTGRKGAWIYRDKDNYVIVCQHPHVANTLLVFPEIGTKTFELTSTLLQRLYKSDHDIQLARYTADDLETLKRTLKLTDYNLIEDINIIEEDLMDWKYPVHIYNTQIASEVDGSIFRRIRQKHNQLEKIITHRPMSRETALKDMRVALKYWEGSMINAEKETDDMLDIYHEFFKILDTFDGDYDGLLYFHEKRPVGFSVWDIVSDDTANFFINLGDASIAGLADFQMIEVCKSLHKSGIKYLNVGGSETKQLDTYKRKFLPERSIQLYSAKVEYKNFEMPGVSYSKFI